MKESDTDLYPNFYMYVRDGFSRVPLQKNIWNAFIKHSEYIHARTRVRSLVVQATIWGFFPLVEPDRLRFGGTFGGPTFYHYGLYQTFFGNKIKINKYVLASYEDDPSYIKMQALEALLLHECIHWLELQTIEPREDKHGKLYGADGKEVEAGDAFELEAYRPSKYAQNQNTLKEMFYEGKLIVGENEDSD